MHNSLEWSEGYAAFGDGESWNPYTRGTKAADDWNDGFQAAKDDDYDCDLEN